MINRTVPFSVGIMRKMWKAIYLIVATLFLFILTSSPAYAHTSLQLVLILSTMYFLPGILCFSVVSYFAGHKLYKYSPLLKQSQYRFHKQFFFLFIVSLLYATFHIINGVLVKVIDSGLLLEYLIIFIFFFLASLIVLLISLIIANKLIRPEGRSLSYALTFATINLCGIIIVELVYQVIDWYYHIGSKIIYLWYS